MGPHASVPPSPRPNSLAGPQARRRPLIGLTPLIDVVFILLVFFMLASSFTDWRSIRLDAPSRIAGAPMEGALLIELREEGIRFAGRIVPRDRLVARLARHLETDPARRVLVKPAAGVPLQAAVELLDRLAAAGVADLSLIRDGRR